jgi:hypothetical protein
MKIVTTCDECSLIESGDCIYCERHQCKKTARLVELCKSDNKYFQLWEDGVENISKNNSISNIVSLIDNRFGKMLELIEYDAKPILGWVEQSCRCGERPRRIKTLNSLTRDFFDDKYIPEEVRCCLDTLIAENRFPTTKELVINFGKAMVGYIKSGFKHVSTEEYKERLDICQNCNNYNKGRCEHPECGCFVAAKAWIESEDCPKNKWPQTEK